MTVVADRHVQITVDLYGPSDGAGQRALRRTSGRHTLRGCPGGFGALQETK